MQVSISKTFKTVSRYIRGFTIYDMLQSSTDFEDVRKELNDKIDWSIELFRSCFTIHLTNGCHLLMLSSLFFLIMAENMHMNYCRLSPVELKERIEQIGYTTFALLFALLDIGSVFVRIVAVAGVSESPALAVGLFLISVSPLVVPPPFTYLVTLLKRKWCGSTRDVEIESGAVVDESQN